MYSCLNVKELLAQNRCDIWSLSDCSGIRTHNHLVRKRTLDHLAKLAKWLSCVVNTYIYGAFDCHVRVEWIHTLSCRIFCRRLYKKGRKKYFDTLDVNKIIDNKAFWKNIQSLLFWEEEIIIIIGKTTSYMMTV